jgi:hypothetical protein
MRELDDLSGLTFGDYTVLNFDHMRQNGIDHKHGMSYYRCVCNKCGAISIVSRSQLIQRKNTRNRCCKNKR